MVKRNERKWVRVFALLVMIATTLPYLIGYTREGIDWRYSGLLFALDDTYSYIAKMLTGSSGSWLFRTPYTATLQQGVLLFIPYLLLGKLAAPPGLHEQLIALFHLFRFTGGVLSIIATYDFLAVFLAEVRWRRLGTALAALGGGLGWLSVVGLRHLWVDWLPLEFYSPETFGFLMILGLPHLCWARAFLLWGLRDYLIQSPLNLDWQGWARSGLLWLGLWVVQPITVAIGLAVIGIHLVVTGGLQRLRKGESQASDWDRWRGHFGYAVRLGVFSAPLVMYTFLAFKLDPSLRVWESQSQNFSPVISSYLLAYGIILPLAILGMRPLLASGPWRGWLVVGWAIAIPFLAYAPFSSQRRLLEGAWVALVVLAMKWIECGNGTVRRWAPAWLSLAFFSSTVITLGGLLAVLSPARPIYLPLPEAEAYQFLIDQAAPGSVVLASYSTSNPLPAWAPIRTITGHGAESLQVAETLQKVTCFYSMACSDRERIGILSEFSVEYVFWGPEERLIGAWDPGQASYLETIYREDGYVIFKYQPPSG